MATRTIAPVDRLEADFLDLGRRVRDHVADAVAAMSSRDAAAGRAVAERGGPLEDRCWAFEDEVFTTQLLYAPFGRGQRLLHVARVGMLGTERVARLGTAVGALVARADLECIGERSWELLDELGELAVRSLDEELAALAACDVARGEAVRGLALRAQEVLGELHRMALPERACAEAVLLGRHLERVTDHARELGGRIHFLATGELHPSWRQPRAA